MHEMTPDGLDAITEILNIGIGRAGDCLNRLLDCHVHLTAPSLSMTNAAGVKSVLGDKISHVSCVYETFSGAFSGRALLIFLPEDASKLVDLLVDGEFDSEELDGVKAGALTEIGNIIINNVVGTFGNILNKRITFDLPAYVSGSVEQVLNQEQESSSIIMMRARFNAQAHSVEGDILLVFELMSFDKLLGDIQSSDDIFAL